MTRTQRVISNSEWNPPQTSRSLTRIGNELRPPHHATASVRNRPLQPWIETIAPANVIIETFPPPQ
jgi:hypothetical protein